MSYTVEQLDPATNPKIWNNYVLQHPQGTFLQTTYWAAQKSHFGWTHSIHLLKFNSTIIGGALVLTRALPLRQQLNYLPYAPLVNSQHLAGLPRLLQHLKTSSSSAIALKIDSPWTQYEPQSDKVSDIFIHSGFRLSPDMQQPEHTLILNLSQDSQQLMADMRQTTRRYIRQAQKASLTVDHAPGSTYLEQFYTIMTEVGQRKQFGVHTKDYYHQVCQAFASSPAGKTHIFLAKQGDTILGSYFLLQFGHKAWELYGGLTDQGQQLKAGYLLKWQAILTMKELGVTEYDQWGIAPSDQSNHPLAGVTYFKQGFGGTPRLYQGSWDFSAKPLLHSLAKLTGKV